jgi:hypothetical protein
MKRFKTPLKISSWRISKLNIGMLFCLVFFISFILAATVNINEVYSAGKSLTAVTPLLEQIKLSQRSAVLPGGRGFMIPQSVVLKDADGKPVVGQQVKFEVASNNLVSCIMRGTQDSFFYAITNNRGIATAANTDPSYIGEGFQIFSSNPSVVTTLKLTASVDGCASVTFDVQVGTYGSNMTDSTPPIITYTAKTDSGDDYIEGTWTNHSVTVSYSATDTLSTVTSCTEPQVFSQDGANQGSKGVAIDSSYQKVEVTVGPINIDKTAPVTNATTSGSDTWNSGTVNIQFNSTDSLSGVDAIYYKMGSGPETKVDASNLLTIDTEGISALTYWAVDKAGNKEEPKTISSKIDKSAPTVTTELSPVSNANGWNNSNTKVSIKATDANSGVKEIHYQIGATGTEQVVASDSAGFTLSEEGITEVTFWAVDNTGNVSKKDKLEVKIDKTNPVIKVPRDILVEATAVKTPVDIGTATFQDISVVELTNDAPKDGFPIGATKVTWTAKDSVGNVASDVQTVTVKDTTKPLLSVQGDVVVEATGVKTHVVITSATATDIFKVTLTNDAPYELPLGKTLIKWTAVDANGNSVSATQNVIVIDSTKPVLSIPANITEEAAAIRTSVDIGMATATDIFKVKIENNAPADFPLGKTDVTWKATDESGNVTTGVQEIIIKDTIKPELTVPKDITVEATKREMTPDIGKAVANDIFKVTLKNDAPAYYPVGTTKVTWTATDENGNSTTGEQNITITDTIAPVLTIADAKKDINAEAEGVQTFVDIGTPEVTDIFEVKLTNNAPAGNKFPMGSTVVTWVATDANGNSATATQNICVEDKTKPTLKLPEDIKIEATAVRTPVNIGKAEATDVFGVELKNDAPEDYPIGTTKVTWTAVDANGNKATGVQNVTVTDTTKPVITIPDNMNVEATGVRTPVSIGKATAKDIFGVTVSNDAPKDYPLGTTKVTWTATDANGNSQTGVQTVTVKDSTEPVINLPDDITKEATALRTRLSIGKASATDIFPVTLKNDAPADFPVGITKITWTATDQNGNVSTKVQNITITDTTKPVITKPEDITQEATAVRTPVSIGTAAATDIFEVTVESNAPNDYPLGTTIVTWTATDKNGNVSTATQNVTVVDKTPPVLTAPKDMTVEATAVKTPVSIGAATATDIFKITGVTSNAPAEFPLGTTVVKWTATDENGNVSTAEQKITVRDTTAPQIKAPSDITTEATGVKTPVSLTIGDPVDIFKTTVTNDAPLDFPIGTTTVKWTIVDENGNATVLTQKVTITDTTKPVLKVPEKVVKEATAVNTPVNIGEATATDIFKVAISNDAPEAFAIGTTKVTWTAKDENGNVSTAEQEVTVTDTTKPVLKVPESMTTEATALRTPVADIGKATATDIFKVTIKNDAPSDYPLGTTKVTWTATDENGNITTAEQNITIADTTKPVIKVPAAVKAEATALKSPVNIGGATATDIFKVTITNDAPSDYPIGVTKVTWKATDENGNFSTAEQLITVVDTTKPVLEVPADMKVEATAVRTPVAIGEAKATDIFKVTITNDAPADYPIGVTKVTWTATDENGNVSTAVQNITIVDTTKPVLKVISDITSAEATGLKTTVTLKATATDIFPVKISIDIPASSPITAGDETNTVTYNVDLPVGTTKVTWTATDSNGNSVSGVQNLTITDTTKPVLKVPKDITTEATALRTPVDIGEATATDIFKVTIKNDAPENYPVGTTKVTWTATDENGNVTTSEQKVTITDTTKPVLKIPADVTAEATAIKTPVSIGEATATDIFKIIITNDAPADYSIGVTKVTWKAVDENGNETTAEQKVIIIDTTKPVLKVPAAVKLEATAIKTPASIGKAEASDIFNVTVKSDAPETYPIGTTKVTWTAIDENGNISTGEQLVTITDTTKPVLKVPVSITTEATALKTPVDIGGATATDIFKVTIINDAPDYYLLGTTKVTWTATDENGNVTTAEQNITITDTTKPVLKVPADISKEATAVNTPVTIGTATATDIYKVVIKNNAPEVYPVGVTKITWTATDENGNVTTAEQVVTIKDTTKPVLEIPGDVKATATNVKTPVNIGKATASDIFKVVIINDAPEAFPVGTTKVTWTATDENGNVTTAVQNVTLELPVLVFQIPGNIKTEATSVLTPVSIGHATAPEFVTEIKNDAPEAYPIGITKVTWTATDVFGRTKAATQLVEIVDTTKPVLKVPNEVTTEATAVKSEVNIGEAMATDIFKVTIKNDAPVGYPIGTTKVTWTATDENGNVSTADQLVTVVDTTKPVLKVAEDVQAEATAVKTPVKLTEATATDIFKVVISSDAPEAFALGTTKVTWKAIDENGNITTAIQNVTITDTTKPILKVPGEVKLEATAVKTPASLGEASASDIFKVVVKNDAPDAYPIGTTKVTWTATDENGNVTTGEQLVTITDTTKPVLEVPADVKQEATAVNTPVSIGDAKASDIFKVTVKNDAPEVYPIGTTKVTWTATDENGNITTAVQNVTITDTTKPVLEVPANLKQEATAVNTPVTIGEAKTSDIFKVTVKNDAPQTYPVGTTKVTWTATDENGNVATAVQNVTVTDTTSPVLTTPADIIVSATGTRTKVTLGKAVVTDIFPVILINDAPADFPVGTTKVTWTATDSNGNVTTAVQNVTVKQNASVRVKAYNNTRSDSVNTLDPKFEIENISNSNVNLSDIKIRYYYTADGDKKQTYWCDYAQVNGSSGQRNITSAVSGTLQKSTAKSKSDCYLEISISSAAGTLKPGEKININGRVSKEDWSNYTQTNDYSFNGSASDFTENQNVTVYVSGILIAGTEP